MISGEVIFPLQVTFKNSIGSDLVIKICQNIYHQMYRLCDRAFTPIVTGQLFV